MTKFKKIIKNLRIILLIAFVVLAIIMIYPNPYNSGVAIRSVEKGSVSSEVGIVPPDPETRPMSRERIISINAIEVNNLENYHNIVDNLSVNETVKIKTNKGEYDFRTKQLGENSSSGDLLGLGVYDAPKSNLIKGLDLEGGTRVLLKPEKKLDKKEENLVIDVLKNRLNIFGLSDIIVRTAKDLEGNQFILVEIAGANEKEVKDLIAKQGKFEAKIGKYTVFTGGGDITSVCRNDAKCSRITGCREDEEGWFCRFAFSTYLSPEAAERQASITRDLPVIEGNNSRKYLSEKLRLYLDDKLVDELNIGEGLKGRVETRISISGSGRGATKEEALKDAEESMKSLQMALVTGALPVKLEIVKSDSLSPLMGEKFTKNALKVGFFAMLTVVIIIFLRYKKIKVALPITLSMLSEIIIILGFAALIKWNLDLMAIAGIVIAVGTGVDDLIVLTDRVLCEEDHYLSWKEKRKSAFFIIMAAYFTTVVAMLPLLIAGAGLLKGFAFTTIIGVTVGVFIVRPAYAITLKLLLGED